MGGKLLGFNVDPNFSDVLDGLILVDVTKTDPKIMERYMPREKLKEFHKLHGTTEQAYGPEAKAEAKAELETLEMDLINYKDGGTPLTFVIG
jgi:hypothetical protein